MELYLLSSRRGTQIQIAVCKVWNNLSRVVCECLGESYRRVYDSVEPVATTKKRFKKDSKEIFGNGC